MEREKHRWKRWTGNKVVFLVAQQPYSVLGLLIVEVSRSHTTRGTIPLDVGIGSWLTSS
jgi:hypothetical protein